MEPTGGLTAILFIPFLVCWGMLLQGHYDQVIVNPNELHAPRYSFPKGHFLRDKKKMQPGPGAYKLKDSIGKQVRRSFSSLRTLMPISALVSNLSVSR